MPTVAIDFDGVIHAYRHGWQDGTIYDTPVDGAIDAIRLLMQRYAVAIFTTRDTEQVKDWLLAHGFEDIRTGAAWEPPFWNVTGTLLVTNRKPAAIAYIDDRGIRFTSWPQALTDLTAADSRDGVTAPGCFTAGEALASAASGLAVNVPSILGMPLDIEDDDGIAAAQPVCGLVVVKALNGDGEVCYYAAATDGLKTVEALGMARYAALKLEHGLIRDMNEEEE